VKIITLFSVLMLIVQAQLSWACLTAETESNNTQSQADADVCSGTVIESTIGSTSDIDWYTFTNASTATIDVSMLHNRRDNFDWQIMNAGGQIVGSGTSADRRDNGSVSNAAAGQYFFKVTRVKGTGWYDLTFNFSEASGGDCGYGSTPNKPGNLSARRVGNAADACAQLSTGDGAVLLMGGGSDVDAAFSNRVRNHIGSGKDIVVLRTSGSDAYNDYLSGLINADSVTTLIIDSRSKASEAYTDWTIRSAEFLWIAGGDQAEYLNMWAGTAVQSAVQHVYDKGGVIGGTSAGMALLSDIIYDPDGVLGAVSDEVVTDFCHQTINFSSRFVSIPFLHSTINDTHFFERDRMGRLLVFMAHQSSSILGIAASESTSIFINANGQGVVDGRYEVYVLRESSATNLVQARCGSPVKYHDVLRVKLLAGDTYNFSNDAHNGSELDISIDGEFTDYYTPADPY